MDTMKPEAVAEVVHAITPNADSTHNGLSARVIIDWSAR
jgi:hypothetical protein